MTEMSSGEDDDKANDDDDKATDYDDEESNVWQQHSPLPASQSSSSPLVTLTFTLVMMMMMIVLMLLLMMMMIVLIKQKMMMVMKAMFENNTQFSSSPLVRSCLLDFHTCAHLALLFFGQLAKHHLWLSPKFCILWNSKSYDDMIIIPLSFI